MNRRERLARLRRALVIAAGGSVCVFVGAWAFVELGAPVWALYALVFAFTAAGVWADQRPVSPPEREPGTAGASPPHPPSQSR